MQQLMDRYRSMSVVVRGIIAIVTGMGLMWLLVISDEYVSIQESFLSTKSQSDTLKQNYNSLKSKVENNKESELLDKEAQLKHSLDGVQGRVMASFSLERIMNHIYKSAQKTKVELQEFSPQRPKNVGTGAKYFELEVDLKLLGSFYQTGSFFNEITNLKEMVIIRNIALKQGQREESILAPKDDFIYEFEGLEGEDASAGPQNPKDRSPAEAERELSEILANYLVESEVKIVLFSRSNKL